MRLVATTRILDEADIVESFVRHTAHYVDHHVFVDNGSVDGTLEILRQLKDEGFGITIFANGSVSFNEVHFNTYMFFHAVRELRADWVLCLDCDEFIDDRETIDGLSFAFERMAKEHPSCQCLRIPVVEYMRSAGDDETEALVTKRIQHHGPLSDNTKIFLRADLVGPETTVAGGNHFVYIRGEVISSRAEPGLKLAHYSERSWAQGAAKKIKGWAKVLAAGPEEIARGTSLHYRSFFEQACADPRMLLAQRDAPAQAPNESMIKDPLHYKGGTLLYRVAIDDQIRAMKSLVDYLAQLAVRHGRLLQDVPGARATSREWDGKLIDVT